MIRTTGLTKWYGRTLAVDSVDLFVGPGQRYGLLGPNGSGKTTVVRMLLGLVFASSGQIEVLDRPVPRRVAEVLPQIGALVETPAAYGHLSGRTNLRLLDAAGPGSQRRTRRARVAEALERVGLSGVDGRPVRAYSLGMRQRLGIAGALLRQPRLLLLDEPTNGLDPRGINEIRELLGELNRAGTTVLLSSHLLSEVEQVCSHIGVLDRGRLVLQEELATLRAPTGRVLLRTPDAARAVALLDGRVEERDGDRLVVRHADAADAQRPTRRGRLAGGRDRAAAAFPGGDRVLGQRRRLRPDRGGMIRVELIKLLRRPRTWIAVALICALPIVVAAFVAARHLAPPPGQGSAFLSAVLRDGSLYPAAAMAMVVPIFLPIAVAVLGGDAVAGEASAGTLRYLLIRPVGRTRLLVAKLVALTVFVLIAVLAVVVTSYVTGRILFGTGTAAAVGQPGGVTSLSGVTLTPVQLGLRLAGAVGFITVSMLGVAAIALFLSTVSDSALGAALGALAVLVVSEVLVTLDAASSVKPYLPTRYWFAWVDFFRDPVFWRDIDRGIGVQLVYVVVLLGAAWANFVTKDVTT